MHNSILNDLCIWGYFYINTLLGLQYINERLDGIYCNIVYWLYWAQWVAWSYKLSTWTPIRKTEAIEDLKDIGSCSNGRKKYQIELLLIYYDIVIAWKMLFLSLWRKSFHLYYFLVSLCRDVFNQLNWTINFAMMDMKTILGFTSHCFKHIFLQYFYQLI